MTRIGFYASRNLHTQKWLKICNDVNGHCFLVFDMLPLISWNKYVSYDTYNQNYLSYTLFYFHSRKCYLWSSMYIQTFFTTLKMFTGEFSVLQVSFNLQRHTGYFLIQVYVPCILIVVLSWVSFWIHREVTCKHITYILFRRHTIHWC